MVPFWISQIQASQKNKNKKKIFFKTHHDKTSSNGAVWRQQHISTASWEILVWFFTDFSTLEHNYLNVDYKESIHQNSFVNFKRII